MATTKHKQIFKLRTQGLTLAKIGKKFGITQERVRQILKNEKNFCAKHQKFFMDECPYCKVEKEFKEYISKLDLKALKNIIRTFPTRRNLKIIIEKEILIKRLRDKFKLTYREIGELFKNDHTTIMRMYKK